jgi:hypothetical protein
MLKGLRNMDRDIPNNPHMSYRENEWHNFSTIVSGHIANYTIPQYGDGPDDEVGHWDAAQCMDAISKYVKRYQIMRRGRLETLRDLAKIAHFACLTMGKMNITLDEMEKVLEGKV